MAGSPKDQNPLGLQQGISTCDINIFTSENFLEMPIFLGLLPSYEYQIFWGPGIWGPLSSFIF